MKTSHLDFRSPLACILVVALTVGSSTASVAQSPTKEQTLTEEEAFFESRIRPVLVKHCLECHAVDTEINGGLSLDSAAGWQRGGDTGVAIEIGKPEASLLIKAIEYRDPQLQMPPEGQLSEQVVADFREWIRRGAADPRPEVAVVSASTALPLERAQEHWSYRPLKRPMPPSERASSPIDAFLQSSLLQSKLSTTQRASRGTLIRRLKFDLHGLPPTPEEIERFEADTSPDAYERLVEQCLASPRFAERMARRWLDVVRYAESLTLRGFIFENAWRYRDYCIEGFAEDRPFDEMLREQIAGDLLDAENIDARQRQFIATTFLLLGNNNLEEQDKQQLDMDMIDEQLDAFGKAILGQTIGCARCHDHKFDPIPTKDYYALAGVFRSSQFLDHSNVSKWIENPLPTKPDDEKYFAKVTGEVSELTKQIDQHRKLLTKLTKRSTPVVEVKDVPGVVVDDLQAKKIGNWLASSHTSVYVGDGYLHDKHELQGTKTVTFEPAKLRPGTYEVRLAYAPAANRATKANVTVFSADGEELIEVDQRAAPPIDGLWFSLGRHRFEKDGQAYVIVSNANADGHVVADAVQFLPESVMEDVAAVEKVNAGGDVEDTKRSMTAELRAMESTKKKLEGTLQSQPKAMGLRPRNDATDLAIHIRGDVHNLGKVVPRGTLQLVSIPQAKPETQRPFDRRDLAEWVVAPEQPLVARVLANRIWSWMMGDGIVRTLDNLGTTGEAPSHPELLDYLAAQLIDHQWSIRSLVREIVLSDAYCRSSALIAESEAIDPDNRMCWRGQRRRLDAESIRDAILAISGQLKLDMYGRRLPAGLKSDYGYVHEDTCRSIYVPALRNALPDVFDVFDVADPSSVVGKRNRSTIASQALWMMNHPWVHQQSQHAAQLLLDECGSDFDRLLDRASLRILGRRASKEESLAIASFVGSHAPSANEGVIALDLETCTALVQCLFQSLDFRFPE